MTNGIKKIGQIVLTIAFLAIGAIYLYINRNQLAILNQIGTDDLIILFLLTLLFFFLTGYTFNLLVKLLGVKLSFSEIIGLSILTNFGNYLGPARPGAILKAVYLKASKGLAYSKFTSILAANSFIALFMTGSAGMVVLILLNNQNVQTPVTLFFVCGGLVIGAALPFVYKIPDIKKKNYITELIHASLTGFGIIRRQKMSLMFICMAIAAQFCLSGLIVIVTFRSFGITMTVSAAFAIGIFTSIANFFTITPNNIGVQEAVMAYLFSITGFDFATGVIGAGLLRVVHMLITFSLTPVFGHYLLKSLNLTVWGGQKKERK